MSGGRTQDGTGGVGPLEDWQYYIVFIATQPVRPRARRDWIRHTLAMGGVARRAFRTVRAFFAISCSPGRWTDRGSSGLLPTRRTFRGSPVGTLERTGAVLSSQLAAGGPCDLVAVMRARASLEGVPAVLTAAGPGNLVSCQWAVGRSYLPQVQARGPPGPPRGRWTHSLFLSYLLLVASSLRPSSF